MTKRFVSQSRYEWLLKETVEGAFSPNPDVNGLVRTHFDVVKGVTHWYVVPDDDPRAETIEVSPAATEGW